MKSFHYPFLLPLLMLLGFLLLPVVAEKSPDPSENVTFTCLQWEPLPYASLFYKKGKEILPLPLRNMRRSLPLPMDSSGTFEIFSGKPDEKGLISYQKIAETSFPPSIKRMLFILDPIPGFQPGGNEILVTPLEDEIGNFPKGSFKFLNTTDDTIQVEFAGNKASISPQSSMVIRLPSSKEGFFPFIVYDEKSRCLYQNQLHFDPSSRELALIKASANLTDKIEMKFVSEIIRDLPSEKPPTSGAK